MATKKQDVLALLDKAVGKKGPLHIPAYWMREVLLKIMDWTEGAMPKIKVPTKISQLQDDVGIGVFGTWKEATSNYIYLNKNEFVHITNGGDIYGINSYNENEISHYGVMYPSSSQVRWYFPVVWLNAPPPDYNDENNAMIYVYLIRYANGVVVGNYAYDQNTIITLHYNIAEPKTVTIFGSYDFLKGVRAMYLNGEAINVARFLELSGSGKIVIHLNSKYSLQLNRSDFYKVTVTGPCSNISFLGIPNLYIDVPIIYNSVHNYGNEEAKVILGERVTNISPNVFQGNTQIHFGSNVKNLARNSFSAGWKGTITCSEANPYFYVKDGILFNKHKKELIKFPYSMEWESGFYSVEDGVERLGPYCFYNELNIITMSLPESLLYIDEGAFQSAYVTTINLPNSLVYIGPKAFASSKITDIVIPQKITKIEKGAFSICWELTNITIPDSVIEIDDEGLMYCNKLNNLSLPANLKRLGDRALSHNSVMSYLKLPGSLEEIGDECFIYPFTGGTSKQFVLDFSEHSFVPIIGKDIISGRNNVKIVVPDNLYNQWISNPNWQQIASSIIKASEYTK